MATTPERAAAGAVILAAGAGTRRGGPKALLEFEGRLLVERAVETALAGGCAQALVVLGAAAEQVCASAALGAARVVVNPGWAEGMGSSLRAGLAALEPGGEVDAALVLLVDQPYIGPGAVRAVLDAWRAGARLAAASYGGRRGHPALFGREHWAAVARASVGDRGARGYLAEHADELVLVSCDRLAVPQDLDVPADLASVRANDPN